MNTTNMPVREKVGQMFASITRRLYGGEITENGTNDSQFGNIDIKNFDANQGYESKASISSDHHKLNPGQIEHNRNLQATTFNEDHPLFPFDQPEIYYMLWQHKKRGVTKLLEDDLEKTIIGNTIRLLVVSFDIIEAGEKIWDTTGKGGPWGEVYMFRSSERANLTKNAEDELKRMQLDPKQYNVTRETISNGTYRYCPRFTNTFRWTPIPEFELTSVINKEWKGLERLHY